MLKLSGKPELDVAETKLVLESPDFRPAACLEGAATIYKPRYRRHTAQLHLNWLIVGTNYVVIVFLIPFMYASATNVLIYYLAINAG
jgi:hypothetical protein